MGGLNNPKSNRIVTSVFYSIRIEHNYSKFLNSHHHRFLTYLTERRRFFTLATMPSNQQYLLLTMVQVLYLLEVFILAHYCGPPSTETPITETTIVWFHKNGWIYLTSSYYWWLLRPAITIQFDSKWKKHYSHSTITYESSCCMMSTQKVSFSEVSTYWCCIN